MGGMCVCDGEKENKDRYADKALLYCQSATMLSLPLPQRASDNMQVCVCACVRDLT